jgi:hypothetical protein
MEIISKCENGRCYIPNHRLVILSLLSVSASFLFSFLFDKEVEAEYFSELCGIATQKNVLQDDFCENLISKNSAIGILGICVKWIPLPYLSALGSTYRTVTFLPFFFFFSIYGSHPYKTSVKIEVSHI